MAELQGLSFPLRFTARGGLSVSSGLDKIKENIKAIVITTAGERVMRPSVGTLGQTAVFQNLDEGQLSTLSYHLKNGIEAGDNRVVVLDLNIQQVDQDGRLLVDIMFKLDTQTEYENLVFEI